jgi:rod shape-determining protein MreB and related proteins
MLKSQVIYIDLGTSHTVIYIKGKGFVLDQPTYLATRKAPLSGEKLMAMGDRALQMFGRTPQNVRVLQPLQEGVIADFTHAVSLVHSFLTPLRSHLSWRKPHLLISLPEKVTQQERDAVLELGREIGGGRVDLLSEPLLAALSLDSSFFSNQGQMVLDLGAGTSEASIISGGRMVLTAASRVGGDHLTDTIIQHLFHHKHWIIGRHDAELLKKSWSGLTDIDRDSHFPVRVQNSITGLPERVLIAKEDIREPLEHYAQQIFQLVSRVFEECPPELAGDISHHGLCLTGGASMLRGLDQFLQAQLGVKVTLAQKPRQAVSLGGAKVLEDLRLLDKLIG